MRAIPRFASNYDPISHRCQLDAERLAIRDSIRVAQSRLSEIETQDSLDFASEKIVLRQYVSDYSSLLAPIRLLPVEMLRRIFVEPTLHDSEMGSTVVTIYTPKCVGDVSSYWREVVLATRHPATRDGY